jgi:HAD superfamily hydrolase (TIGR01509 family)
MTPTAYLFDIGNVILGFDFTRAAARIAAHCEVAEHEILPRVQPFTNVFETGVLSVGDFIAQASEKTGYSGSPDHFQRSFEDIFTVNTPIVSLIERLAATDTPLYLLSNTNAIHVPYFTGRYPVFGHFEGAIYSHEVGAMKPDEPMYHAAVDRYGLTPETTVYIDDLPANIETGQRLGFHSFQYDLNDHDALERWLDDTEN